MAICENEPKASGANKAKILTIADRANGQFAGKALTSEQLTWLACAIESEGSIQLTWGHKKTNYIQIVPRVNLANQAIEYQERAVSIISGHISALGKTGVYQIVWYGMKRVKFLLESILPYMVIKRKIELAKCVLEFVNYRLSVNPHVQYGSFEKDLFFRVRKLNGKGMIDAESLKFRFEESSTTTRHAPAKQGEDIVCSVR